MSSAAPTTAGGRLRLLSGQPEQRELHLFPPRAGGGGRRPRRRRASLGQVPPQPHAVGAAGGHPPRHAHVLVVVRRLPPPQRDAPRHTPRGRGPPTLSPAGTQSVRGGSTPATHSLHVVVGLGGGRTASLKHHCGRNMSSSRNAISAPPWRLSRWRGSLVRWPNLASNHSLHLPQRRPRSFHRRIVLPPRTSSTRCRLAAAGHRSRSAPPPSSALYYTHGWRG
jgi:hypothetical protein